MSMSQEVQYSALIQYLSYHLQTMQALQMHVHKF